MIFIRGKITSTTHFNMPQMTSKQLKPESNFKTKFNIKIWLIFEQKLLKM